MKQNQPLSTFYDTSGRLKTGSVVPEGALGQKQRTPSSFPLSEFYSNGTLKTEIKEEKGLIRRGVDYVVGAAKGDAEFDYPEISELELPNIPQSLKVAGGFLTSLGDEGRANVIKKYVPDAKFSRDVNDNIVAEVKGKKYYVNKPGFSKQDVIDISGEVAKFSPGAKLAGLATKGLSRATKIGAQGVAAGGTTLGSDVIGAEVFGSKEPADPVKAAIIAGFGAGGEFASPYVVAGLSKIWQPIRKHFTGKPLSEKDIQAIEEVGIKVEDLTEENLNDIFNKVKVFSPEEKARIVEAQSLPEPIPQTTGQITQDPRTQSLEYVARKTNTFGEEATSSIKMFDERQDQAIAKNINMLAEKFGGAPKRTPTEIGAELQEKLVKLRETKNKEVSKAYKLAKEGKAFVPKSAIKDINDRMRRSLEAEEINIDGIPEVKEFFEGLNEMQENFSDKGVMFKINTIERIRKRINANIMDGSNPRSRESFAAGKMVRAIDSVLDDYIEGGLLSGDKSAVTAFKEARKTNREFKKAFDDKDAINKLTRIKGFGADAELIVGADDAINLIFSKSSINKTGAVSDIRKLKKVLPKADFDYLKQGAFLRLLGEGQKGGFSAQKFFTNLKQAKETQPKLMQELFSKKELKLLSQFANVAKRAKVPVEGGWNPSQSATTILNAVGNFFGTPGKFITQTLKQVSNKGTAVDIMRSVEGAAPAPKAPSYLGAATGAAFGQEVENIE